MKSFLYLYKYNQSLSSHLLVLNYLSQAPYTEMSIEPYYWIPCFTRWLGASVWSLVRPWNSWTPSPYMGFRRSINIVIQNLVLIFIWQRLLIFEAPITKMTGVSLLYIYIMDALVSPLTSWAYARSQPIIMVSGWVAFNFDALHFHVIMLINFTFSTLWKNYMSTYFYR